MLCLKEPKLYLVQRRFHITPEGKGMGAMILAF